MNMARIAAALLVLVLWSAVPAIAQTDKVAVVALGTTLVNLNPLTHLVSTIRVTNNLLFDGSRSSTTRTTSRSPTSPSRGR